MLASGRRAFQVPWKILPVGTASLSGALREGPAVHMAWYCALQVRADSPTIGGRRVLPVASRLGIPEDYSESVIMIWHYSVARAAVVTCGAS